MLARPSVSDSAPAAGGHDFTATARVLLAVGACGAGEVPAAFKKDQVKQHCETIDKTQAEYKKSWVDTAKPWFAAHVPATVPKKVVYPFAGGDLSTALTVYPDADEITTLSLEPAGDPRALGKLDAKQLKTALGVVETELGSLYRSNFSVTMNMIGAMRSGQLPTQLIFSLSALTIHGYEPTSMRYFKLTKDGDIEYLSDKDLAAIDKIKNVAKHNRALSNVEIKFHKIGGTHEQTYRHIMANLDDEHIKADPSVIKHLDKKGTVAGMTKAASYLLSFGNFEQMRKYIIGHVAWMVSDSTGLPPKVGEPAGFEYETWGTYERSNMAAGGLVTPQWKAVYKAQPKRDLAFRFGYPDKKLHGHLIIMKKKG
jgi:hypothetical protein